MAQLFETVCMSLVFNKSHSLAMHYCRLVWDVRSLSKITCVNFKGPIEKETSFLYSVKCKPRHYRNEVP